jgi:hypothetical protein
MPIKLEIKGLGHVPAMKNNKMMTRGRLITNPERQEWMERCIRNFECQLVFGIQTSGEGTLTVPQVRYLIASQLPEDDCWTRIPQVNISALKVEKGEEGATIIIEEL